MTGATGAVGANGTNGAAGTNGGNGATWYTGTTIPGNGTGVVNDLYLRTTNSDYYKKTGAATWVLQGNLTGATGSAGANGKNGATGSNGSNGATWYTGTTIPGNATGVVNDLYLRTTNDDYYKKTGAATWTLQGNLTGSNGIAGTNGAAGINGAIWYTGTTIPGNATGVINDLYLRTTTGDYYKKTGINTWTLQANLTGPAGVTGAAGSANINGTLNHLIKFNNATSGINSQIFDNGTKVGVGTTSPTSLFHINTDGTLSNGLRVSATTPATIGASITLEGASKTWNILATNTSAIPGANKLVFRDFTSAADRMIIDATGNVGIGISSPLAKLHVVKSGSAAATGILGQINSTGTNDYNGVEGIAQGTGRQFGIKGTASGPAGLIYDSYADYGSAAGLFLSAAGTGIMANTTGVDSLNCSGSTPRGTSGFCSTQSRGIVSNVNSTAEYQTAIVAQASSPLPYQNIGVNAYANNGTYAYGIIATATNGTDGTYAIDAYAEGTSTDDVYGIHAYAFNGGSGNAYAGYFSGDVVNSGYTQLGYSSPAIQMRKYTGTTASTQGGSVTINTGLTPSKILSVDIMVEWGTNSFLHPGYNLNPGYEFFWFGGSSIVVANSGNNSGLILSKPFKILVTYEK